MGKGAAPVSKGGSSEYALVTGGGGFLGKAIVSRLLDMDYEVSSFSRRKYPELEKMGVRTIRGDISDKDAVKRAFRDIDVVFHNAAKVGVWGRYEDYYNINVRGTENVVDACRRNGVDRLIFTSSPSVIFDGSDMEGVDESVPYPAKHRTHYSATKALGERAILSANDDDLWTLVLRPHLIWGPGDNNLFPKVIKSAREGKLRRIGDGSKLVDTVYVDNAAHAHVLAAAALRDNPGSRGRPYFISNGEPRNVWDIINDVLRIAGVPLVKASVSKRVALISAGLLEYKHRFFRLKGEPRITRFLVEELSTSHYFDISAARKELSYEPLISMDEGLDRLKIWFEEIGI